MRHENTGGYRGVFESRVLQEMEQLGSCTLDELVQALHDYTWVQVFIVVDRLSRNGALTLRHPTPFEYVVEIGTRLMLRHPAPSEYLIEAVGDAQAGA
jgi:hypothetical protein